MAASQAAVREIRCDGCTLAATPEHLRRRIARLEWASRFRPIHISTLFLTLAPPAQLADYFYHPGALPLDPAALALIEDLRAACGISAAVGDREGVLRELQHGGFFVAEAVECPIEPETESRLAELLSRLTPTLALRVHYSYRPKSVLLLSERLRSLVGSLASGAESELLLWEGGPVPLPASNDVEGREQFRRRVRALLEGRPSA